MGGIYTTAILAQLMANEKVAKINSDTLKIGRQKF